MTDYVRESIEAISALQIRQNDMQTMVTRSIDGLSEGIVSEVSKMLVSERSKKQ